MLEVTHIICDEEIYQTKYSAKDGEHVYPKCDFAMNADTLKRISRVCAVQNDVSFDQESKSVKSMMKYDKADRIKIKGMFGWKKEQDWVEGTLLPFRYMSRSSRSSVSKFYTSQWIPNRDSSSNALVRWSQDKPLWDSDSYKIGGVDESQWTGDVSLKDTYDQAAVDFECAQPGMQGYKAAFPIIWTNAEGCNFSSWMIPFNSRTKFSASVHKVNNDESKNALLLMKGVSDVILKRCDHVMHRGERVPLTEELRAQYTSLMSTVKNDQTVACAELEITTEMIGMKAGLSTGTWKGFIPDAEEANFPLGEDESVAKARAAYAAREPREEQGDEQIVADGLLRQSQKLTFLGFVGMTEKIEESVPQQNARRCVIS